MAASRFDWPEVMESTRFALVASRVCVPFIEERREGNSRVWSNPDRWRLGFYFGEGDTRLWVPRRLAGGEEHPTERVINFSHRRGKPAFRILMLAYATACGLAGTVLALILGVRW